MWSNSACKLLSDNHNGTGDIRDFLPRYVVSHYILTRLQIRKGPPSGGLVEESLPAAFSFLRVFLYLS